MDTYYGLVVHDVKDSWRSYLTIWDDEKAAEKREELCEELPEQNQEPVVQNSEPVTQQSERQFEQQFEQQIAEDIRAAELAETTPSIDTLMISPELENPEVLRYLQETEQPEPDPDARWQAMRKEYPKIQPFDHDGDSEVLAIRPDDIGKLPRECWIYGNNSFLLHGYYNYRYLILVRLNQETGPVRYLLGVPGHYYSNEKYMATMFGFPNFVLSKKQPPNDGRFGYWYTDIKLG